MAIDKIAVAGLVVGIVGGLAGIIGAIAAVYAAKYAKGSATQSGLEAVEKNTARTTEQITAVRAHIAQVDDHLRVQNGRHDLAAAGDRVAIVASGEAWANEVMPMMFILATTDFVLYQIELVSDGHFFIGAFPCKRLDAENYLINVPPEAFNRWHQNGRVQTDGDCRTVSVRVTLMLGEDRTTKTFSGTARMSFRQGRAGMSYYNHFNAQC